VSIEGDHVFVNYWGANLATSFEATRTAEIAWICDVEEARAKQLAAHRPMARTATRVDDVLDDPSVSAVAISTPTSTHYMLAKRALAAGKHVLVEKPITVSVAQASDLVEAARQSCHTLMVGHVFEYNSTLAAVKEIIRSGELGELYYFNFERTNLGPVRTDVNALWDLASHDVSIMCDLVDACPVDVTASGQAFLNRGIEDVVFATFSFANSVKAHVHASWLNPRKVRQMAVIGKRKMLVWDDLDLQMPVRVFNKRVDVVESNSIRGDFLEHKMRIVDYGISIPHLPINRPL
jgi:predicted dehydrogenase